MASDDDVDDDSAIVLLGANGERVGIGRRDETESDTEGDGTVGVDNAMPNPPDDSPRVIDGVEGTGVFTEETSYIRDATSEGYFLVQQRVTTKITWISTGGCPDTGASSESHQASDHDDVGEEDSDATLAMEATLATADIEIWSMPTLVESSIRLPDDVGS